MRSNSRLSQPHPDLEEATIAQLQAAMEDGRFTALSLARAYADRIEALDRGGPAIRSVLELNPDLESIATGLDDERRAGEVRGPLHGIPLMLKDNIDTADRMQTTAGSLALLGSTPAADAGVAARLRAAGAVIMGKTNLSEWANFRSTRSSSGWSGRGGQTLNPFVLDRSPIGSSSGSAAAVSANLAAAALGTETDGSIISPSTACGVVGIKPTVGLTSRAGVIPVSHSQDTVGPHGRCVADAAIVLSAIAGTDPRDPATAGRLTGDFAAALGDGDLRGVRIGVLRGHFWGYHEASDRIGEAAVAALRELHAELIDPVELGTAEEIRTSTVERDLLQYEFKAGIAAYLGRRNHARLRNLGDLIAFNEEHADRELRWFGQEIFAASQARGPLTDPGYLKTVERSRRLSRAEGLDALFDSLRLQVLVAPSGAPAWTIDLVDGDRRLGGSAQPAAMAGYPIVTVPAGFAQGELPVGFSFIGRAWSEALLVRIAHAFERATRVRRPPTFLPTLHALSIG